jgi:antagonist of KipI
MAVSIVVRQPGLLTTIQDQGRMDYLSSALSRGGAQDHAQLEMANLLVGNLESAAGLEITALGPTLLVEQAVCLACCGAPVQATVTMASGRKQSLPMHRPVVIEAGSTVRWSGFIRGFRAWVAFAGGIEAPVILGSRSSHLAAELGPPRLAARDRLLLGPGAASQTSRILASLRSSGAPGDEVVSPSWSIANRMLEEWPVMRIPVLPGRHWGYLPVAQQELLMQREWRVDSRSNRQGLALDGEALGTAGLPSILSEPVRFGSIQLPPGGKPFVLMAEHQTTGGYPRVLEVAGAARPLLAQAGPDARLRFVMTTIEDARHMAARRRRDAMRWRDAIRMGLGAI